MEAQAAGRAAADEVVKSNGARYGLDRLFDVSAGAVLHLQISARSALAAELKNIGAVHPELLSVLPGSSRREILLGIHGMSWRQEQCVNIAAEEAALEVLRRLLAVDGYVTSIES